MNHPFAAEALKLFLNAIHERPSNTIILLIGPTGVGKSTVGHEVENQVTLELMPQLIADPGRFSSVWYECESQHGKNYYWPGHYRGMLKAMEEPLVDKKRWPTLPARSSGKFMPESRAPGPAYQPALINALLNRRPTIVLLDEGQHMTKISSGMVYEDQMNIVKSLANRGESIHGLLGTYQLNHFIKLTAQLGRRGKIIHFPRYHANVSAERSIFKTVLPTFEQQLPVSKPPELVCHWEYIYERSIGCVGVVKDWLAETLKAVYRREAAEAAKHGATSSEIQVVITLEDLRAHEPDLKVAMKMLSEADEGERDMKEPNAASRAGYRKQLGLIDKPKKEAALQTTSDGGAKSTGGTEISSNKSKKKLKPFKQRPVRHKLGDVGGEATK